MSDVNPLGLLAVAASLPDKGLEEVRRVVAMPTYRPFTAEEADAISRAEVNPAFYAGTHPDCPRDREGRLLPYRLWRQQAEALFAFEQANGGFFPLRVGAGKSLIGFLCLKRAHDASYKGKGVKRSLLVVPARGLRKLRDQDVERYRRTIDFDVPVHFLAGLGPKRRMDLARSGLHGVYATSYSLMQQPQALQEMMSIKPQIVVADEAHLLANAMRAAGAFRKRFFKLLSETRAMFVAMSGTMSRRTFLDAWPVIKHALGERSPVPLVPGIAQFWAQVIDSQSANLDEELLRSMAPLVEWAIREVRSGRIRPEDVGGPLTYDASGIRRAYKVRRNTAPGVVASAEHEVGSTLVLANRPCWAEVGIEAPDAPDAPGSHPDDLRYDALDRKIAAIHAKLEESCPRPLPEDFCPREAFKDMPPWERMVALLWAVEHRWRTPNGDEIEYGFHLYGHSDELSSGFYNELIWPLVGDLAAERGIPVEEAEKLLDGARRHRLALSRFYGEMRPFLEGEHLEGLDTPLLVWNACHRRDRRLPDELYRKYLAVRGAEFPGMPARLSKQARVCDWKVRAAIRWARGIEAEHGAGAGGLIWAFHNEMLDWLHEEFVREFGPDRVLFAPRGRDREIADPANASRFCVASIAAHGEIKELQHWGDVLMVQFPRPANLMEQTLGRAHRFGQKRDELVVTLLNTLPWEHQKYSALLHDSCWLTQVESPMKVIHCDYDPRPFTYPSQFLREHGFRLEGRGGDEALRMVFGGTNQ